METQPQTADDIFNSAIKKDSAGLQSSVNLSPSSSPAPSPSLSPDNSQNADDIFNNAIKQNSSQSGGHLFNDMGINLSDQTNSGDQNSLVGQPPDNRNWLQKGSGIFLDTIAKTGIRAAQATASIIGSGSQAIPGVNDLYRKISGNQDTWGDALSRVIDQPMQVPGLGTQVKPPSTDTLENVAGTALSTISLGLPGVAAAGAGIGLGSAMENDASPTNAAVSTVVGALSGKILEYGFNAVAPYVEKAALKFGQPLIDGLQKYIPDSAGQFVSDLTTKVKTAFSDIPTSAQTISDAVEAPFNTAVKIKNGVVNKVQDMLTPNTDPRLKALLDPTSAISPEAKAIMTPDQLAAAKSQGVDPQELAQNIIDAQKAKVSGSATPLEKTLVDAQDAIDTINQKLENRGSQMGAATDKIASTPVQGVNDLKSSFVSDIQNRTGATFDQNGDIIQAQGRKIQIDPSDQAIIKTIYGKFNDLGLNPTFQEVDDTVNAIQKLLYKKSANGLEPVDSVVSGLGKEYAGKLNDLLRDLADNTPGGEGYVKANDSYSRLIQLRNDLNSSLGPQGDRAGSLMKKIFSPADSGTKAMFDEIKRVTGIDLYEKAVLAKSAMDMVGDTRGDSMLKQLGVISDMVQNDTVGKIGTVWNWIKDKIGTDSIAKALREAGGTGNEVSEIRTRNIQGNRH